MERLNTVIDWIGCLMLDVKKAELNIKKQEKLCLIDLDQEWMWFFCVLLYRLFLGGIFDFDR